MHNAMPRLYTLPDGTVLNLAMLTAVNEPAKSTNAGYDDDGKKCIEGWTFNMSHLGASYGSSYPSAYDDGPRISEAGCREAHDALLLAWTEWEEMALAERIS